jgi:uncharacterized OB-fold protein
MDLPKPEPTELSRPFWDALRDGHLVFQRCGCGHAFLPARRHCPACCGPIRNGSAPAAKAAC